ncbi:5'/3'-nucleotidase SurE [Hyphomonas sp. GM-8P]|uniref:5'/3'-nucleotidase SurE n=1 Tax=Hyphomonas sp. GM-8P TaxID=1280945 RepID=UPI000DBF7BA5|nr:5'/3'-nucleotidase SurE [Hyphomonas sp. GM-8P]RAN39164.1 stationary phase survival protein SurE [Hyphomonas sp. GM-8P]
MRILLTNDDGINAPGLSVLEEIAKELSDDIWIAAPEEEQSGKGRAISLTHPVRTRKVGARAFAITGTPSDCVLLATHDLMPDKPDLVLSGVNRGQNIAEDTSFSGTIAAAMFGMQLGIPSIALSQSQNFRERGSLPWDTARTWGAKTLRPLIDMGWPDDVVMNVNFPDVEPEDVRGVQITRQGFRDESIIHTDRREDLRGNDYYWIGYRGKLSKPDEGTDLRAIYEGYVSVSPLHVDLTHEAFLQKLRESWQA